MYIDTFIQDTHMQRINGRTVIIESSDHYYNDLVAREYIFDVNNTDAKFIVGNIIHHAYQLQFYF